jgi:hypothetical protein
MEGSLHQQLLMPTNLPSASVSVSVAVVVVFVVGVVVSLDGSLELKFNVNHFESVVLNEIFAGNSPAVTS